MTRPENTHEISSGEFEPLLERLLDLRALTVRSLMSEGENEPSPGLIAVLADVHSSLVAIREMDRPPDGDNHS